MNLARKGFVHLLAIVLFFSLLGVVATYGINSNFGTPKKVEKLLSDSHIYDNAISSALDQSQEDTQRDGGDGSISLSDPGVKKAAEKAFPPQLLEQSVNQFLDGNYAWLTGKTTKPEFKIDLTKAKQDFATRVGNAVTARLRALPVCTAAQQAKLQIPVDAFTVSCRPKSLDPTTEGNRVKEDLRTSDFLSDPVLTADSIGKDKDSHEKPYYLKAPKAPTAFRLGQKAPFILAGLALLTAAGIIFIHPSRRVGLRRVGVVLTEAGVILIVSKLIGDTIVKRIRDKAFASTGSTRHFQQQGTDLLNKVESYITRNNLWFGIAFVILALIIFVYLFKTREGGKPKTPKNTPTEPQPIEEAPVTSDLSSPPIEDRLRQPKPTGPPPLGPNPPKRKPPRLIQ